jgi:hypothetical protein
VKTVSKPGVVLSMTCVFAARVALGQSAPDAGAARAPVAQPTPVQAPVPPPVVVSPFNGVWRYVGGDGERRAFEASVTRTVQGMGFFVEGIAAARLRDRSPLPEVITIRVQGNQIEFTGVRGRLFRTPADGTPIQTQNPQGEPITLSTRINGNQMVRHGARPDGARREVITVNGNTLVLEGTVTSPRLPRPLTYRFTFRR